MPEIRRLLNNTSGQALLIAIAIGLVLVISVTAVVFVNQIGTSHQVNSSQRTKSRAVAAEGISYATQELSSSTATWQSALTGNFPSDCNLGHDIVSPSGSNFRLYCSTGVIGNPNIQDYNVAVVAVAMSSVTINGTEKPLRSIQTYLSQRSLGADLATGVHAAAALQLWVKPSIIVGNGTLNVHWGPIVSVDPLGLVLSDPMDSQRYPRKFSVGPITGAAYPRSASGLNTNTDQEEYWAEPPMSPLPLIDESWYLNRAQNENFLATVFPQPTSKSSGTVISPTCVVGITNCGYYNVAAGDTAIFDAVGGYNAPPGAVIFVNGNAQFNRVAVDSVSFIVMGQLIVNDSSTGNTLNLHVPVTAPLEYPYSPSTQPCQGDEGHVLSNGQPNYDCSSTAVFGSGSLVQFRGFLYVKGYMYVGNPIGVANVVNWNMVGALFVGNMQATYGTGGQLIIGQAATASLNLAYDDEINHSIHVAPITGTAIELQPDRIQDISSY